MRVNMVKLKLYEHEGELYVLARSDGRQAKEIAMRHKTAGAALVKGTPRRLKIPRLSALIGGPESSCLQPASAASL